MSSLWVFIFIIAGLVFIGTLYYLLSLKSQRQQKKTTDLASSKTKPKEKEEKTLQEALTKTRQPLLKGLHLLSQRRKSTESNSQEMEQLEALLYASDMGPKVASQLLKVLQHFPSKAFSSMGMKQKLKEEMLNILSPVTSIASVAPTNHLSTAGFNFASSNPSVWLFMGVNGVGKTTTIGKLAAQLAEQNQQVLVAASDTFRAAADKQLEVWTQRAQVHLFNPPQTKDPCGHCF